MDMTEWLNHHHQDLHFSFIRSLLTLGKMGMHAVARVLGSIDTPRRCVSSVYWALSTPSLPDACTRRYQLSAADSFSRSYGLEPLEVPLMGSPS